MQVETDDDDDDMEKRMEEEVEDHTRSDFLLCMQKFCNTRLTLVVGGRGIVITSYWISTE